MQISSKSEFGQRVAEFSFIKRKFEGQFDLISALTLIINHLEQLRLFIPKTAGVFIGKDYKTSVEINDLEYDQFCQLIQNKNEWLATLNGITEISGIGKFYNGIYLQPMYSGNRCSVDIVTTLDNFLEYDLDGKPQLHYQANARRLKEALNYIKQNILTSADGWFFNLEPTMYAAVTEDGSFITSPLDEETGEPLVTSSIADPIVYVPPLADQDEPGEP